MMYEEEAAAAQGPDDWQGVPDKSNAELDGEEGPDAAADEESELYEHYRIQVDGGQEQVRIDKFLLGRLKEISRNRIQVAMHAGSIRVNEGEVKPNYRVKPRDLISIVLSKPPKNHELFAEDLPLDIIYQDEHLAIINKAPGMVVHPGHGNDNGTLVNALLHHIPELNGTKGTAGGVGAAARPGLVHRIDKDTSGLLVIAKNEIAMTNLAKQFFDHSVERTYATLAWGDFLNDTGTVRGNIGRSIANRTIMDVFPEDSGIGRHAITHFKVLERFTAVSLLEMKLETGRTHQIRAHLRSIGHPIFNDATYGGNAIVKGMRYSRFDQFVQNCFALMPRMALHARTLGFKHPKTRERMFFESPLPDDFANLLERWRRYQRGTLDES